VVDPLAESIIYLCALIADRPRAIDRYIDYFGETRPAAGVAALQKAIRVTDGPRPASEGHERRELSRQEA